MTENNKRLTDLSFLFFSFVKFTASCTWIKHHLDHLSLHRTILIFLPYKFNIFLHSLDYIRISRYFYNQSFLLSHQRRQLKLKNQNNKKIKTNYREKDAFSSSSAITYPHTFPYPLHLYLSDIRALHLAPVNAIILLFHLILCSGFSYSFKTVTLLPFCICC